MGVAFSKNCINLDERDGAHIIIVDVLTRFMGLHLEDLGFSGSGKDGCMNSVIVDENELDSTRLLLSNPFYTPVSRVRFCHVPSERW